MANIPPKKYTGTYGERMDFVKITKNKIATTKLE